MNLVQDISNYSSITCNSKEVQVASIFVCIKGTHADGHKYIEQAANAGASLIVISNEFAKAESIFLDAVKKNYPQVEFLFSDDTRMSLAELAAKFFNEPSKHIDVYGVTGTNGKTTVTHLIQEIFDDGRVAENAENVVQLHAHEETAAQRAVSRPRRMNDRSVSSIHEDHEDDENAENGVVQWSLEDWEPSYDVMYSCGPKAMLKALQSSISSDKLAYMSLEERMGCGVGACLACVCNYNEGFERDKNYSRVCTEGPVYKLHEISL